VERERSLEKYIYMSINIYRERSLCRVEEREVTSCRVSCGALLVVEALFRVLVGALEPLGF
jgi:hypothetical protein